MCGRDWLARNLACLRAYLDTHHGHRWESVRNLPTRLSVSYGLRNRLSHKQIPPSDRCEETVLDLGYPESSEVCETWKTKSEYVGQAKSVLPLLS